MDVTVASGTSITATLTGLGVVNTSLQSKIAGSDGRVRLTWTVNTVDPIWPLAPPETPRSAAAPPSS